MICVAEIFRITKKKREGFYDFDGLAETTYFFLVDSATRSLMTVQRSNVQLHPNISAARAVLNHRTWRGRLFRRDFRGH